MTKAITIKLFRYAVDGVNPMLYAAGDPIDVPPRQFNSLEAGGFIRPAYVEASIAPVAVAEPADVEPVAVTTGEETPKRGRRKGRGNFRDGDSGLVS